MFLNRISNAIDAIGKDGLIEVRSRRINSNIGVEIQDNGPGIPEGEQKRIFDPFFTTKKTRKNTGLGLWISYNIIEKLGGSLSFKSKVREGTTFTIQIPVVFPEKK